jgi:hypothetical protein
MKNQTKRAGLVQSGRHHHHLIPSSQLTCSRHEIAGKLALNNNLSLTQEVFVSSFPCSLKYQRKKKKCSSHFLMFMMISTSIKINKMNISIIISKINPTCLQR